MWFIFALLSVLFAGLHTFSQKVAVERKCDVYLLNALSTFFSFVLGGLFFTLTSSWALIPAPVYWLAILSGIIFIIFTVARMEALRFIDSAIFFPLYKVIGPAIAAAIGIFLLKDAVSPGEVVGIVLSCAVPLLLISRIEHHRQKNLKLGLILLVFGTLLASINAALNSIAVKGDASLALPFLVIAHGCGAAFGLFLFLRKSPKDGRAQALRSTCTKQFLLMSLIVSVFQFCSFYSFLLAFSGGDLSIVYSINAHYIVIPVILSVIFYKEHWSVRKACALIISLLALVLLHH